MAPIKLTLSGTGNIRRQPERGVVSVTIKSEGSIRATVSEKAQQAAKEIQAIIRSLAVRDNNDQPTAETAIKRWSSSGMAIRTWTETYYEYHSSTDDGRQGDNNNNNNDNSNNYSSGNNDSRNRDSSGRGITQASSQVRVQKSRRLFEARVNMVARFCNFEKLSGFVVDMATRPMVTVRDTDWVLTEETQATLEKETIKKAYGNAFAKARAYADAMGLETVRPIQIDETSSSFDNNSGRRYYLCSAKTSASGPGQDSMSAMPQDVVHGTCCEAIFEIE